MPDDSLVTYESGDPIKIFRLGGEYKFEHECKGINGELVAEIKADRCMEIIMSMNGVAAIRPVGEDFACQQKTCMKPKTANYLRIWFATY